MIKNVADKKRLLGSGKLWRLQNRLKKFLRMQEPAEIVRGQNVYVGCGDKTREGYLGCDIRPLDNVSIVCPAWDLSQHCQDLNRIYSRHMVEHLTFAEAKKTLTDWHAALAVGGEVEIEVPNMRFHIEQWLQADWTEEAFQDKKSDARWGFAGFYGWQRECDPDEESYNQSYWDVHKSGYDEKLLKFMLESAGFVDVETRVENEWNLIGTGSKVIRRGERQVAYTVDQVRPDHRARYDLVAKKLKNKDEVLDIACGIGYGCKIMSAQTQAEILGVDINPAAIDFAKTHYSGPQIEYQLGNANDPAWAKEEKFDVATSFETIEHIEDPLPFLKDIARSLKKGGKLYCSTPNEVAMPYTPKFKFHFRHYTPEQFSDLLEQAGFEVVGKFSQFDKHSSEFKSNWDGIYLVAECVRK